MTGLALAPRNTLWSRLRRRPGATLAMAAIAISVLVAIAAPLLALRDPFSGSAASLLPPLSPGHPLGTDHLGRDLWSQLVYGARVSLAVGILAAASAVLIGTAIGAIAGYVGGVLDNALMRLAEFFQTLPRFVLAIVTIAFFGSSVLHVIIVIAILSWPQTARLVRAGVITLRSAAFVEAARLGGKSDTAIVVREILPNVIAPIVVTGSLDVAAAILLEAGLGFFGLGDPNLVSWGGMLNQAQQYLRQAWWMSVFPGLAITVVVLAFNLLGDALNDALNPRLRDAP
ncbi:MAG: ABC transporter permease [Alphaproteobacteria bacterium]|nr:ABC transporter permease [Alphaproteobacteria bacterium]